MSVLFDQREYIPFSLVLDMRGNFLKAMHVMIWIKYKTLSLF